MSSFNNICRIYNENETNSFTGYVVRKAISERDISLIITSHKNVDDIDQNSKMFAKFDGDSEIIEIKLYSINNDVVFFKPVIPLYDVVNGSCFFNVYNNNYYGYKKDTKHYLWKYDGYIRQVFDPANEEYVNSDGMIIASFEGVVFGMIVNNKMLGYKDINNILSKVLDDYFKD